MSLQLIYICPLCNKTEEYYHSNEINKFPKIIYCPDCKGQLDFHIGVDLTAPHGHGKTVFWVTPFSNVPPTP
jgi:hypothetical protein